MSNGLLYLTPLIDLGGLVLKRINYCIAPVPLLEIFFNDFIALFQLIYLLLGLYLIGYWIYKKNKKSKLFRKKEKVFVSLVLTYLTLIFLTIIVGIITEIFSWEFIPSDYSYLFGIMWFLIYMIIQVAVLKRFIFKKWEIWMLVVVIAAGILMVGDSALMITKGNQVSNYDGYFDGASLSGCGGAQNWY